jgi:hypothetical protein
LREEADWVRREILAAQTCGTRVVPVIKGRKTDRLARASLPPELMWLADVHSMRLDMHESTDDLTRIGDFLADLVPTLKAADRTADEPAASGATDNAASDVTGNLVQGRDVSGGVHAFNVRDTTGPAMLGDGNTQNNLNVITARLKRPQQRHQPIDHLHWLAERFVPPPGFDRAQAVIEELRTVILDGPSGAGRTTAAQMLVFNLRSGRGELHELDPQEPDEGSSFPIDPDLIGPGDGMWIDLSDAGQQLWSQIQQELPELRHRVLERHAHLVVIQPPGMNLHADFRRYLVDLDRPPQEAVFDHLLRVEGLANGADLPAPAFLNNRLSMRDIRQFVDDVLDARAQRADTDDKGDLKGWIEAAGEPAGPPTPAEHFDAFLDSLDPAPSDDVRLMLTSQIARLVDGHDHKAADEMRRRYSEPDGCDVADSDWDYPGAAEGTPPE